MENEAVVTRHTRRAPFPNSFLDGPLLVAAWNLLSHPGPNIAIFTVRVQTARICNVKDEVTLWDVNATGEELKQRY